MDYRRFDWSRTLGKGTQPVSVLQNNVLHYLETVTPDFVVDLKKLVEKTGLKPGLSFHCQAEPIIGLDLKGKPEIRAASVDEDNRITFHETFLSYLWCISYALVVLYDEANAKPARGIAGSSSAVRQARRLLRYGLKLRRVFKPWKILSVPNPQRYGGDSQMYVEKANGVFCFAAAFVLLHEIAHVHLEHTETIGTILTTFDSVTQEVAADKWAIRKIKEGFGDEMDTTKACGVIAGLVALLLLSPSLACGRTHPDLDERLRDGVSVLALPEKSSIWLVALVGVRIWEQTYDREIEWPSEVVAPKQYFLRAMAALARQKDLSLSS